MALLSALSYAPINVTTNNQTEHCLVCIGTKRVFANNIAIYCDDDHGLDPSRRWVGPPPVRFVGAVS
ncbi:hypothetical protein BH09MYX1_BH09MYX1_28260 [soil metagenome]